MEKNLNKLEDRFFCIEVLTKAKFSIKATETELLEDIERIITSLTAITEASTTDNLGINYSTEAVEKTLATEKPSKNKPKANNADDDDTIIDLLTGEKIG